MSRDDTMLDRWSRRKRAVAAEEQAEEIEATQVPDEAVESLAESDLAESELAESELLEKLGLPDPDTMQEGDDFAAFMRQGVPDFLRKRALRTLWLSNPDLANLDGLLDYGEDFTDAAMVPKVMNTLYQVGKGMLREKAEPAEPTLDEIAALEEDQHLAIADPAAPNDANDKNITEAGADESDTQNEIKVASEDLEVIIERPVLSPRRMRFQNS